MTPPDSPQLYVMARLDGLEVAAVASASRARTCPRRRQGTPEQGWSPSRSTCSTRVGWEASSVEPGIRRAAFGAPEGFSDAVAWMSPLAPDENRPAHWSVTFAVDDTRATAERTLELGGSVLVEPFDGEVVRIAVRADPQGAVFGVNQFEPEGL
jgi:predicted enzyme related to lactoylglutathione lyase